MKIIKEAVQNLVIYMFLVTIILNLVKASSFKKYIELFTGLILILILFTPVVRLIAGENVLEESLMTKQFLFESRDSAEFIYEAEADTKKELLRLYSEKMKEQIQLLGKEKEMEIERVKIELSEEEEGFGSIERIEVWLKEKKGQEKLKQLLMGVFELEEAAVSVK